MNFLETWNDLDRVEKFVLVIIFVTALMLLVQLARWVLISG